MRLELELLEPFKAILDLYFLKAQFDLRISKLRNESLVVILRAVLVVE